ncbi:hypothetical protein DFH07DRAFT_855024 [Mycena maculata]|uniref:Uncharacterized protein n=1 Tax=Mycena maculata TaxID=230809 RepID=A0AAD7HP90_9AGAR|nr:hypothetical protein DFH07DRAFT_855024 [Mycena maculata]
MRGLPSAILIYLFLLNDESPFEMHWATDNSHAGGTARCRRRRRRCTTGFHSGGKCCRGGTSSHVAYLPSVGAFAPPRSSTRLPTSELIDILPSSHCSVLSLTRIVSKDAHCIVPDGAPLLFM